AERPKAGASGDGKTTTVTMPELGESITEGTITRWIKQEGDEVEADEPLFEVSTDKVDTEVPSPVAGVLKTIKVQADETVEAGAEAPAAKGEAKGKAAPAAPPRVAVPLTKGLREEVVPATRLRKVIAERMVASLQTSAQLTSAVEIDMTRVMRLRERAKDEFKAREGVSLSPMPFAV